jgi:hypothetical protein
MSYKRRGQAGSNGGGMRRSARWLVRLALGGAALSSASGALGLWARRTPWPLAAVFVPEAPAASALPAVVGCALALIAGRLQGVRPARLGCVASGSGAGGAKPATTPASLTTLGVTALCMAAAVFAGWPLLVLPWTAARFQRAMDGLLGAPPTRPDAAPRGLLRALVGAPRADKPGPSRSVRGVVYRTEAGLDLALDLYLPLTPGPHPLVVVVHGGGWYSGDRRELPAFNRWLAGHGYAVAAPASG